MNRRLTAVLQQTGPVDEPMGDWLEDELAAAEHETRLIVAQRCELHPDLPDDILCALACHSTYPAVAR